jgi:hypothetical protein
MWPGKGTERGVRELRTEIAIMEHIRNTRTLVHVKNIQDPYAFWVGFSSLRSIEK